MWNIYPRKRTFGELLGFKRYLGFGGMGEVGEVKIYFVDFIEINNS